MSVIVGRDAAASTQARGEVRLGRASRPTGARSSTRDDIDLIDICSPGDSHAEIAIAALDAGKHVLCEKPLANTVEEAERMAEAAERAAERGVRSMVGFTYRRVPGARVRARARAAGRIGEVRQVARELPAGLARRRERPDDLAARQGAGRLRLARRHRRARHRRSSSSSPGRRSTGLWHAAHLRHRAPAARRERRPVSGTASEPSAARSRSTTRPGSPGARRGGAIGELRGDPVRAPGARTPSGSRSAARGVRSSSTSRR